MAATRSSGPQLFSGGNEMGSLILSTGVLEKGWSCVSELERRRPHLPFSVSYFPNFTIIAFSSSAAPAQDEAAGAPEHSAEKLDRSSPLGFLIKRDNPEICIHRPSLSAFHDLLRNEDLTTKLRELQLKKPSDEAQNDLVLVGRSLGGSVAALFALWLLKNQNEGKDQIVTPLCVTYGSPFIGGAGLQKAIDRVEALKARFWHIVGDGDDVPRLAARLVPGASAELRPFGTYFLCSPSRCTCVHHPESVIDLLQISRSGPRDVKPYDYGALLQQLKEKTRQRSAAEPRGNSTLRIGLAQELLGFGIADPHQVKQSASQLLKEMEDRVIVADIRRKVARSPSERLDEAKKQMALLEWYRKRCEQVSMDYYDCFKERSAERDYDVINIRNILNRYWKEEVEEAENNPQTSDGAPLGHRHLFSGTTYKRLVEPLDIADYYRKPNNREYMKKKRAHHYIMLEKWYDDAIKLQKQDSKERKAAILTEDSCFWAHVEEAALMLKELNEKRGEGDKGLEDLRNRLKEFEGYVWKLICNHELSTTVFFESSTFMKWWRQYERDLEHLRSHDSDFIRYMKNEGYASYTRENSQNVF
ncbi:unnamed protein product [Victoria cruziana]